MIDDVPQLCLIERQSKLLPLFLPKDREASYYHWSFVEAVIDDDSILNKASYYHCFCPKIERQICEVEH